MDKNAFDAFWVDELFAPNLGLATTQELLEEVETRIADNMRDTQRISCLQSIKDIRIWMTPEELAYKVVQPEDHGDPYDEDINPYEIQKADKLAEPYIYLFKNKDAFVTFHEPGEVELAAVEENQLRILKLENDGTLAELSENGTLTPLPVATAEMFDITHFTIFDPLLGWC